MDEKESDSGENTADNIIDFEQAAESKRKCEAALKSDEAKKIMDDYIYRNRPEKDLSLNYLYSGASLGNAVDMDLMDRVAFYVDARGEFRWKRTAANNKIVGASSESYHNLQDCIENFERGLNAGYRFDYSGITGKVSPSE